MAKIVLSNGQVLTKPEQLAAVMTIRQPQASRLIPESEIVAACRGMLQEWQHLADDSGVNLCDLTGRVTLIVNDLLAALGIGEESQN